MAKQKTVTIESPTGASGLHAGVEFDDKGKASIDADDRRVGWFRRRGYVVDGERRTSDGDVETVDARDATGTTVGTPLRDAAVNPHDDDFLPPVNAGEADPHGREVVSPQIHGTANGPKPVVPGPVEDDLEVQETDESQAAAAATHLEPPPRGGAGSGRDEWSAYARGLGIEVTDAMDRNDIIAAVEAQVTSGDESQASADTEQP